MSLSDIQNNWHLLSCLCDSAVPLEAKVIILNKASEPLVFTLIAVASNNLRGAIRQTGAAHRYLSALQQSPVRCKIVRLIKDKVNCDDRKEFLAGINKKRRLLKKPEVIAFFEQVLPTTLHNFEKGDVLVELSENLKNGEAKNTTESNGGSSRAKVQGPTLDQPKRKKARKAPTSTESTKTYVGFARIRGKS